MAGTIVDSLFGYFDPALVGSAVGTCSPADGKVLQAAVTTSDTSGVALACDADFPFTEAVIDVAGSKTILPGSVQAGAAIGLPDIPFVFVATLTARIPGIAEGTEFTVYFQ